MTTRDGISGLRVLVVEDDYWVAATLVEIISEAGAEVVGPVDCVRDALAALDSLPHVASLDVQLGSETSFPIADELDRRGVPFIFATGAASMIPAVHASRPICHKPASRELVVGALCRALDAGC
jgi:DNA-binding response OmpR family regulator